MRHASGALQARSQEKEKAGGMLAIIGADGLGNAVDREVSADAGKSRAPDSRPVCIQRISGDSEGRAGRLVHVLPDRRLVVEQFVFVHQPKATGYVVNFFELVDRFREIRIQIVLFRRLVIAAPDQAARPVSVVERTIVG